MKLASIQIWLVGYISPFDGFEPVCASVFKWDAERRMRRLPDQPMKGKTIRRIPLTYQNNARLQ